MDEAKGFTAEGGGEAVHVVEVRGDLLSRRRGEGEVSDGATEGVVERDTRGPRSEEDKVEDGDEEEE